MKILAPRQQRRLKCPVVSLLSWPIAVVLLASLSGCARYYWSKAGASAEQFSADNGDCVRQAVSALPVGSPVRPDAIEVLYRACLRARGYVRDKQFDPPPPGSYRGLENGEEFAAVAVATPRQGPEPQVSSTSAASTSEVPVPVPPGLADLVGIWRGDVTFRNPRLAGGPLLRQPVDLRIYQESAELRWTMTHSSGQGREVRASGVVRGSGKEVTLNGRYDENGPLTGTALEYVLTREGPTMSGTATSADRLLYSLTVTRQSGQ
jgi:hypothetical protein